MMQTIDITSIKDARVVEARVLTSAAGRARLQKMQLEGEESIQWALEAQLLVEHVFSPPTSASALFWKRSSPEESPVTLSAMEY